MTDALFYGQQPGVGYAIFAILLLVGIGGLAWNEGVRVRKSAVLSVGLPLLFFSGMIAVRDNGFVVFLDVCVSLYLMGLLAHFYAEGNLTTLGIAGFLGTPWRSLGNSLVQATPAMRTVSEQGRDAHSEGRRRALAVFRGLLLAVPVLAVFLPLLISADAVFAEEARRFTTWLLPEDWSVCFWRVVLIGIAAWMIAGGCAYALTRTERSGDHTQTVKYPLGYVEGMTPLVLISLLFGAFVAIQFAYLFGGNNRVQMIKGLTYAAYARQGFGELVTVAVLTLGIATLWQRLLNRQGQAQERGFQSVMTLLAGLTLVMLVSAFQRMAVYESAYGATETRLYVDAFILCLGAILVWFVTTLWGGWQKNFAFGAFLCLMGYVAYLNFQNTDAMVVRTNIDRAVSGKQELDDWSLGRLSDDAIPTLCAAFDRGNLSPAQQQIVALRLKARLDQRESEQKWAGWPSWNASRQEAYRALTVRAPQLDAAQKKQDAEIQRQNAEAQAAAKAEEAKAKAAQAAAAKKTKTSLKH